MSFIKICGVLVDILVEIAPDFYKSHVTTEKMGVKQFLVQCQNALYGTMVASLLYYRKFTKSLTEFGFKINPYDPCVSNKMIDGKQMTICYHGDECKLSHLRSKVNDQMIKWLRQEYESIFEDVSRKMAVSRGKVHKYLGMNLYYTVCGQVQITMIDFLDTVLVDPEKAEPKGDGTKKSAEPENIFKVNKYYDKLPQSKTVQFHNLVENSLYTTKRSDKSLSNRPRRLG